MQSAEHVTNAQTTSASQAIGTSYVAVIYEKQTVVPYSDCCGVVVSKVQETAFFFSPLQDVDHEPILTSHTELSADDNALCVKESLSMYEVLSQTTACSIDVHEGVVKAPPGKKRGRKPKRSKYDLDPNVNPNLPKPSHSLGELLKTRHPNQAEYNRAIAYYARKLGISVEEVKEQLDPGANLTLQQLFAWSHLLDEPFSSFLPIHSDFAEDLIRVRSFLIRLLKTVKLLMHCTTQKQRSLVVKSILDMYHKAYPEFDDVKPWPTIGQSRAAKGYGAIVDKVDTNLSRLYEQY